MISGYFMHYSSIFPEYSVSTILQKKSRKRCLYFQVDILLGKNIFLLKHTGYFIIFLITIKILLRMSCTPNSSEQIIKQVFLIQFACYCLHMHTTIPQKLFLSGIGKVNEGNLTHKSLYANSDSAGVISQNIIILKPNSRFKILLYDKILVNHILVFSNYYEGLKTQP